MLKSAVLLILVTSSVNGEVADVLQLTEDLAFAEGPEQERLILKLAALRDPRCQEALADAMLSDPPPSQKIQESILNALSTTADSTISSQVARMAKSSDVSVRQAGIVLLGRMKSPVAAALLAKLARSAANSTNFLRLIVRSMGQNGHSDALPELKALAERHSELDNDVSIARFQVGDAQSFPRFFALYQEFTETLTTTAWGYTFKNGSNVEVRRAKAHKLELESTLLRMQDALSTVSPTHLPSLLNFVLKEPEGAVLELLFVTLPSLINSENAQLFLPVVSGPSTELALLSAERICEVGSSQVVNDLHKSLRALQENGDVYSRRLVLESLHLFPKTQQQEILLAGLNDSSLWVREKAIECARHVRIKISEATHTAP